MDAAGGGGVSSCGDSFSCSQMLVTLQLLQLDSLPVAAVLFRGG